MRDTAWRIGLTDVWAPPEFHEHVLHCLDRMRRGQVGQPEGMMLGIAQDIATAPDRYVDLFTAEELVPLLSADHPTTRELALQVMGRI